ncbi:MAG: TerD family protein [Deltaproteobacteria bacterium]|jgi:tellurium resistance protein TerD|nr:TerD family protein [Deltaproteobacteria bacterium]
MAISLKKGANISLSKEIGNLKEIFVALGWEPRVTTGEDFDLDASAFLLKKDNKTRDDLDFIFYNNLTSREGSVVHQGDEVEGGVGDCELIVMDLMNIPPEIVRIAITVTIYEAELRRQNFGMVSNSFIRIVNRENDQEIARFDLSEDMGTETAMIFGEVYRYNNEWKFKAVGQGFAGGLAALCAFYGVVVQD